MSRSPGYLNPAVLPRVKKFQRTFATYFPHLHDIEEAASEWNWLHVKVKLNPMETVRRSKAKAEVKKVAKALRVLIQHGTRNGELTGCRKQQTSIGMLFMRSKRCAYYGGATPGSTHRRER
jgi:hypothetical protein